MKLGRAMFVAVMAWTLTMPVLAQQTSSEKEARQAAESVVDAHNQAIQKKDAAGLAALYEEKSRVAQGNRTPRPSQNRT